jgi:dTDP-4-dehydrorhamnose 3,5-epimerase-like enzyme
MKKIDVISDQRGDLLVFENGKNIQFELKRLYIIKNNTSNFPRGFHAHKKLKQFIFCTSGSCKIITIDKKMIKKTHFLKNDNKGIVVFPLTWREIHDMSPDCVINVLCDQEYDESDYISSMKDFENINNLD